MIEPIRTFASPTLVLAAENIDTDQIIPARFLTTTSRDGLGVHAFADWRARPNTVFDDPRVRGGTCKVLVAGDNFGCGSSREHAAWALFDLGIRAVVSTRIADIFRRNALQNGILPIEVDAQVHGRLMSAPFTEVRIDLEEQSLTESSGASTRFEIDAFARHCLLNGTDELDWLRGRIDAIELYEEHAHG